MAAAGGYLAVARVRKPHGLKGEVVVWSLTDDPDDVLAAGRQLMPIDDAGRPNGPPLVIERSRPYRRQWLLKFVGVAARDELEGWRERLFGVAPDELRPPAADELYLHEMPGARVVRGAVVVGTVKEWLEVPGGLLLAIETADREVLVPYRRPIVTRVDRATRTIEIDPPAGLLEL